MKTKLPIGWLLVTCLCIPPLSRAQNVVSARELSIPPKAHQAFQKGIERLERDDAAGGLPHFQRAVAELSTYYEAYFEIGTADLRLGRTADAEQALRKSIELSGGQYAEPLFALGATLIKEENNSESVGGHPSGFGSRPNVLGRTLLPRLGVVQVEPLGGGREKCPRGASSEVRFPGSSSPPRRHT
jgi:hypothetical protein